MNDTTHIEQIKTLENHDFSALRIKRVQSDCYLIIDHIGKSKVLVNKKGKPYIFRHAWQIKDWLKSKFGIDPNSLKVENQEYT
jgi:hypothetical protein